MIVRRLPLFAVGSLGVLVAISAMGASAATNTVPPTNAGMVSQSLLLEQLTPPQCAGMNLTVIRVGGRGNGGGNALVLGTDGNDTLTGGGGDDCIVGGGGIDTLSGQGGNDVLISGRGLIKILNGGGGNDTCYAGGVLNLPSSCETYTGY